MTADTKSTRREFLQGSEGLAGTVPASPLAAVAERADPKRPNIVFFLGGGQRADALSIGGHKILKTPNHDRIGAELKERMERLRASIPVRNSTS